MAIGILKKVENEVRYYPSPLFMEAGRFKMAVWLRKEVGEREGGY